MIIRVGYASENLGVVILPISYHVTLNLTATLLSGEKMIDLSIIVSLYHAVSDWKENIRLERMLALRRLWVMETNAYSGINMLQRMLSFHDQRHAIEVWLCFMETMSLRTASWLWYRWRELYIYHKESDRLIKGSGKMALNRWIFQVEHEVYHMLQKNAIQSRLMSHALQKLLHLNLHKGINCWRLMLQELLRARAILGGAFESMRNRHVGMALRTIRTESVRLRREKALSHDSLVP